MSREPRFPPTPEPIDIRGLRPPFAPKDAAAEWLFRLHRLGIRPGLESIRELLAGLGHPERAFPSVVVGGTNGKGSSSIVLEALARSAGLRTGLYTSPHFLDPRERIRVDGRAIEAQAFFAAVSRLRPAIERTGATFFEGLTAIALDHFARAGVEVAILEAGLGGRLDATNAVPKAAVLLTSVGLDHQDLLGNSLEAIAAEKLGLAAPGVPFYLDALDAPILRLATTRLAEVGARAIELGALEVEDPPGSLSFAPPSGRQRVLWRRMRALYADLARHRGWPAADPPRAAESLRLVGRYQVFSDAPRLVLDGAHNAHALLPLLAEWAGEGSREQRILVFGAMQDKPLHGVFEAAVEAAGTILVCAPRWPRAARPENLTARFAAAAGERPLVLECPGSVRASLERARREARRQGSGASVLVCGSNFLVAEALDRLGVDDVDAPADRSLWEGDAPLRERSVRAEARA